MQAGHLLAKMRCALPIQLGSMGPCMGPSGVSPSDGFQKWSPKSSSFVKVFITWNEQILDCFIAGEYPKISEFLLHKIPCKITSLNKNLLF